MTIISKVLQNSNELENDKRLSVVSNYKIIQLKEDIEVQSGDINAKIAYYTT